MIRDAVEMDIEFMENIAKGVEVVDEKKRPQNRTLGHTCSDWDGVGFKRFELHELNVAREIGVERVRGCVPMEESLQRRMVGEMVSKAVLRSRRMRMETKFESAAMRRSLIIFMRAVSEL